jgi:hypothetical protein
MGLAYKEKEWLKFEHKSFIESSSFEKYPPQLKNENLYFMSV